MGGWNHQPEPLSIHQLSFAESSTRDHWRNVLTQVDMESYTPEN